jgi:hypothetical protein
MNTFTKERLSELIDGYFSICSNEEIDAALKACDFDYYNRVGSDFIAPTPEVLAAIKDQDGLREYLKDCETFKVYQDDDLVY